ncbi:type I-E CRISPR-associated protein Cse1/CasA [Roseovarius salinarum]|uniref:type I-E CRISPR-associated protein Cse1/CasA n=1 Tax=Roseovarius salinarum TaxID=1981892 RepID=UPI000C348E1E|nr:type I-E CRISPR-associated protein Cse1/CasA [Roseovarius salinarum]
MLNLISDPWIPVHRSGGPDVVRPDQIAEEDVLRLGWPRPDLNLACLELLVGLVYLAAPPRGRSARRTPPTPDALHAAMAPLAPAFELLGDGPRFLQEFGELDGGPNPPDMLFIDSAGDSTAKKNADLMVRRERYQGLDLPLAAMALYTMQAFAPSGGAGNRTSMRGGGPMVTLVRPQAPGLWPLIWANVPDGRPLPPDKLEALPWMRPTRTSANGEITVPQEGPHASPEPEVFFGQPRRLRLVANGDVVTGVVQRPWGTNYAEWRHPLTPYYRDNKGQVRPVHPKPGRFGYRNWRGVILQSEQRLRAATVARWISENRGVQCSLIVGGWAMNKFNPLDFIWSEQPVFALGEEAEFHAGNMVETAEHAGFALRVCIRESRDEGMAELAVEAFFDATQAAFESRVAALAGGAAPDPHGWLSDLRHAALDEFDRRVIPGLADLDESHRQAAVQARAKLLMAFGGRGHFGKKVFDPLGLEQPPRKKRKEGV